MQSLMDYVGSVGRGLEDMLPKDESFLDENGRLTLAYRDLTKIPTEVAETFAARTLVIDLSFNRFSDLTSLEGFTNIHTLILDNNVVKSSVKFPNLPKLRTLWLNKNNILYLTLFVDNVSKTYPKLTYLSLLNNVAAPSYLNGGTQSEYIEYRHYVISQLLELTMLDDKPVTKQERAEAERLYMEPKITDTTDTIAAVHSHPSTPTNDNNHDSGNQFEDSADAVHVNKWNDEKEMEMRPVVQNGIVPLNEGKDDTEQLRPQRSVATNDPVDMVGTSPRNDGATNKFKKIVNMKIDADRLYRQRLMGTAVATWRGQVDCATSDTDDVFEDVNRNIHEQHQEEDVQFGDLTKAQCEELEWAFRTYRCKKNNDAILTKHLRKVMRSIGWNLTEKKYAEMQAETDPEGSGIIKLTDFRNSLRRMLKDMDVAIDVMDAFRVLDQDGDGAISIDEFRFIMKAAIRDLPKEELEEMIEDMDLDGDGQIDFEEFASLVKVGRSFEPSSFDTTVTPEDWS